MKKSLIVVASGLFVFLLIACGGTSNEDACKKFDSLCKSPSGDAGPSGVTVTLTCKPESFDKMSNDSDVKDCIDKAADCNAAVACLMKAKPE